MIFNYILIDYENLQSIDLSLLKQENFRIIVFIGSKQEKISTELAIALHSMGERAVYIKISGNGPNALDFHISFYIGQLASSNPQSRFYIISNDTGFDPLLEHLKQRHIRAYRITAIEQIEKKPKAAPQAASDNAQPAANKPVPSKAPTPQISLVKPYAAPNTKQKAAVPPPVRKPLSAKAEQVVAHLKKCSPALPRTIATLSTSINHVFKKALSNDEVQAIIGELRKHRIISVEGTKVTYHLNSLSEQVGAVLAKLAE